MNLVDSLKKGRYVVITPDHKTPNTNGEPAGRNDNIRETEPTSVTFINALPIQSTSFRKIVLNASTLNKTIDATLSANIDFPNGLYRLNSFPTNQYIIVDRGNSIQTVSLSCQLKNNKRYLITFDLRNQDMISSPRVYNICYQKNLTQYSIDYTLTDRGLISFVLDASGTNDNTPNFNIQLCTNRIGAFMLFSCSIEEI